jgi:hypothetical protein
MRLLAALVLLLFVSTNAHAEWRKSETRHFTIYSEGSELSLRNFAIKVERFDTVLRRRFGVSDQDFPQKLTIFMLPTQASVAKASAAGRDVAGIYIPNGEGSIAIVNRASNNSKYDLDADAVLFHEYSHHFMYRYLPIAYPAWFSEGFAEFLATTDFTKEGYAKRGLPPFYRAEGLLHQEHIPVWTVLTTNVDEIPAGQHDSFYGRFWLLVHFLNFTETRLGQLSKYLTAINGGTSNAEAAREAFGDLKLLDKELTAYLNRGRMSYKIESDVTPAPERVDITTVSAGAGATMMQFLALRRGVNETELPSLIGALNASAQKFPRDPEPQVLLAEAKYRSGDDSGAVQAADAALALVPTLSRASLYKGRAMLRQNIKDNVSDPARWKEARGWIVKANRADVNDPMPLFVFYQSFHQQGLQPSPSALQGLARAYQMVPEDRDIRLTYAFSLAAERKFVPAIRLIETVAFDPHNGPGSAGARSILKRLHAAKDGKGGDATDIFGDEMENKSDK